MVIHPSLSIAQLKIKIRDELGFTCARLIVDDCPLDDSKSVTTLAPGTLVRAAMAKQGRQKRKVNHGPGSKERRQIKARQAADQLKLLLDLMTPEQLSSTLKQLEEVRVPFSLSSTEAFGKYQHMKSTPSPDQYEACTISCRSTLFSCQHIDMLVTVTQIEQR